MKNRKAQRKVLGFLSNFGSDCTSCVSLSLFFKCLTFSINIRVAANLSIRQCLFSQCQAWPVLLSGNDVIGVAQVCFLYKKLYNFCFFRLAFYGLV